MMITSIPSSDGIVGPKWISPHVGAFETACSNAGEDLGWIGRVRRL